MKNSKINQELENIINLMGEHVSFVENRKVEGKFFTQNIEGQVTDILLSLDGNHQFSIEGGDFFIISEVDFKVLDTK